jgi:uracil-DNA glycosylase
MIRVNIEKDFDSWRMAARRLLQADVAPEAVLWGDVGQSSLFADDLPAERTGRNFNVPARFIEIVKLAACFDADDRWAIFYRLLFRLMHENKNLLEIESDVDVRRVLLMRKAVARDIHKFHAFVRFRQVTCEDGEVFVAWHEPHHFTVELSVPFFVRRFGSMRWSILTPKGCANWDMKELKFSPPISKDLAPKADMSEEMWLIYYRSIFNPFRLKVKMMKKEMPVRHWQTLPESRLIPELIREAKKT